MTPAPSPPSGACATGIIEVTKLAAPPWPTLDPFLFCVHHHDAYPAGNASMALDHSALHGRNIGMDFSAAQGWSMYHGDTVPGFPRHPHRGFETVTLARRGFIDHSDSLGATARFGQGDVQWMTAGAGIVHSEMFPLLNDAEPNPTELFQIWMNLPADDKLNDSHFTMFWAHDIPRVELQDNNSANGANKASGEIVVVAGTAPDGRQAPAPPPSSWASRANSDIAIWTVSLEANAGCTIPAAAAGLNRVLYFFDGDAITVNGEPILGGHAIQAHSDRKLDICSQGRTAELLLLQGRPINEPIAQHGPFVMNSNEEIRQAIGDFQRTQFGGWPWSSDGPVHPRSEGRFARHPDGTTERPTQASDVSD